MSIRIQCRWLAVVATCLIGAASVGCGSKNPRAKPVQGEVVCAGMKVPTGTVRFISADGSAPQRIATIADGRYSLDAAAAIPLGKWRVEVDARKRTGRKVQKYNGVDYSLAEEEVQIGPIAYSGASSPLVLEVSADFSGTFDIVIPSR